MARPEVSGTQLVIGVLGGARTLGRRVQTREDLAAAIRRGLPFGALEVVANTYALDRDAMSRILGMSPRNYSRRKQQGKLSADESDRLYRLARVIGHAIEVFENEEDVRDWLNQPNRALGKRLPSELLATDMGAQEVDAVIGRLEHGVYS